MVYWFIMDTLELIKRNTQEIIEEKELVDLLNSKKTPSAYLGFAPTGRLHVGHLIPLMKVGDFLKAGFNFTVLIADLHAFLDDQKTLWHLLDARSRYYEECIKGVFESLKIDTKKLKFVKGSTFQLNHEYMLDVLRMVGDVTLSRSKRAASEVVRFKEEPKLGVFIYPLMQIEDVVALKADIAFGGEDQRKIYMLAREILPSLGYKKPICVFNPLLLGLTGGKMSSSEISSKIDLLDDEKMLKKKLDNAYCPAGETENNGVLSFIKYVSFPHKNSFKLKRDQKYGGDKTYKNYDELINDFVNKKIHPQDLKNSVFHELNIILAPIRKRFETPKNKKLLEQAYSE